MKSHKTLLIIIKKEKNNMAKAATREKQFIEFCNSIDKNLFSGKISFENEEKVYVSVDNSIIFDDEILLIEIDASNQAKLVSGQYTILNLLKDRPSNKFKNIVKNKSLIFFVVHCYGSSNNSKYNPARSLKNFEFINRFAFKEKGLKSGAVHFEDLIVNEIDTKEKLLNEIRKNIHESYS
jgi:hypothetical protein